MIGILKKLAQERRQKKALRAFLQELEQNLEIFHVMDQRQFITQGFATRAGKAVKDMDRLRKQEAITVCMRALEEFNLLFQEYKDFEQWYSADLSRKTPENARKLHGMKQELESKLRVMDAVIIPAGQALEKEMLALNFLKA